MKEIKTNDSRRKAGYNSPSVRIIDVRMRQSVLYNGSFDTETEDGGNI